MADPRFIIVATPRTGSTLLGDLLNSHSDIFCDNELYNPHQICRYGFNEDDINGLKYRNSQPIKFWNEFFFSEFAEKQKAIGFNFMIGHNYKILEQILKKKEFKIIFLTRDNKLAQYSSHKMALSTQCWSIEKEQDINQNNNTMFDFRQFEHWLHETMTYEVLFGKMLELLKLDYIYIEFKQLLQHDAHRAICNYLDVKFMPLKTSLRKQNKNQIIDRFQNQNDVREYLKLIGNEHWGMAEL